MRNDLNVKVVSEIMGRLGIREKSDLIKQSKWESVMNLVAVVYEQLTDDEKYRKSFERSVEQFGYAPIKLNGRMKAYFGWYKHRARKPVAVELSKEFYLGADLVEVMGTVLHEASHYYLHMAGEKYDDGDYEFETLLKLLGAPSTGVRERTDNSRIVTYSCGNGCTWVRNRRSSRMRGAMCSKHRETLKETVTTYGEYKKKDDTLK